MPYFVLAILLGIFMFVYGEYDDSPGGQLIGLLTIIVGIAGLIKRKKKTSDKTTSALSVIEMLTSVPKLFHGPLSNIGSSEWPRISMAWPATS